MASLEAIWRQAKADLVIRGKKGELDTFLWEHSARVARAAAMIAGLPDVNVRPVDPLALAAAALYHDAGWVVQYREGLWTAPEILSRATSDLQRELAAGLLEEKLGSLLAARSRDTAALTIRRAGERDAALAEVQILAEASALDEIGILAFWQTVRRCTVEGKGVRLVLETWKRQKEYHFWEARVADAFRIASVRDLACRRLQRFAEFMDELERQYESEDLARLAGPSKESLLQHLPSV